MSNTPNRSRWNRFRNVQPLESWVGGMQHTVSEQMSSSSALLSISGVNSSIISNAPVVAPEEHNKTIEETKQDDNHQSDPNEEDI